MPQPAAGAAQVDVTPGLGAHLLGYLSYRCATGIVDPLHAKAIALSNGNSTLGFVICAYYFAAFGRALEHFADPSPYHGLYDGALAAHRRHTPPPPPERTDDLLMNARVFFYSPQYDRGFTSANRCWYCGNDWPRLMATMSRRFPRAAVTVFSAAPLQLPRAV
jgi:hypothetical protein